MSSMGNGNAAVCICQKEEFKRTMYSNVYFGFNSMWTAYQDEACDLVDRSASG